MFGRIADRPTHGKGLPLGAIDTCSCATMRKREAFHTEPAENPPWRVDKPSRTAEARKVVQEYIDDQREVLRKLREKLD